jgi:hypothetical protein
MVLTDDEWRSLRLRPINMVDFGAGRKRMPEGSLGDDAMRPNGPVANCRRSIGLRHRELDAVTLDESDRLAFHESAICASLTR